MSEEPDYVNELPDRNEFAWLYPPEEYQQDGEVPRCQHVFEGDWENEGRSVEGRSCGLPACVYATSDYSLPDRTPLCYFHARINGRRDSTLAERLGQTELFVAEHHLWGAELEGAGLQAASLDGAQLIAANLRNADLQEANLRGANLQGTNLRNARLAAASLKGSNLLCANLQHAHLVLADLEGAQVGVAKLQGAWLRFANLQDACLLGSDLRDSDLQGANLRGADLNSTSLRGADLRRACIDTVQVIGANGRIMAVAPNLADADLHRALLTGMTLAPEAILQGATIECPIRDEQCARNDDEWQRTDIESAQLARPTFTQCESAYRQLKLNFQESGDYQRAGEFYLRERECFRAQAKKDRRWGTWLGQSLIYYLCGHGERWWFVALWMAVVVFVCALFQGKLGIMKSETEYVVGPGLALPSWAGVKAFGTALYFSAVTFTSLGYGDMLPSPGWGRALVGIEAALGLALMSLLLVCIVRKFSR